MSDTNVKHGSVKWFNRKKGFGFITPQNDDGGGDVFVHHTGIVVQGELSRYLIDNEYVQYTVEPVEPGGDRVRAVNVRGMNGGSLACESRRNARPNRLPRRDNRRNRDSCPVTSQASCGWRVVQDADKIEDKVFADKSGAHWRLVRYTEDEDEQKDTDESVPCDE
tara:strand:+ start:481 stop:975 length:495 start_codon:yes stop_codon:yes gene_type:complete